MKSYLFIGSALVVLVSIGAFLFWPDAEPVREAVPSATFPTAGSVTPVPGDGSSAGGGDGNTIATMVVTSQMSGKEVITKDFINNGSTIKDDQNPDRYFLAGKIGYCLPDGTCPAGAASDEYNIVYQQKDGVFFIALLKEPLAQARNNAQQFLISALGISEAQMCTLKYYIGTDSYTNEQYAGQNLLFSFCRGAIPLPT